MSYFDVQRLISIRKEYEASEAALTLFERGWSRFSGEGFAAGIEFAHIVRAKGALATTYITRLFSEAEAILKDYLTIYHPRRRVPRTAESLLNRVALLEHIPDAIRDEAHRVRAYRNTIVHFGEASALSLQEALSALNRFVARLP